MVADGMVFDRAWLRANRAIDRFGTWLKTMPFPLPSRPSSTGRRRFSARSAAPTPRCSARRAKVNGFDETIKYGGGDKEFGIRLENAGVRGQHLRYTAPLVHLDHPRGYKDPEQIRRHKERIPDVRRRRVAWTEAGIRPGKP